MDRTTILLAAKAALELVPQTGGRVKEEPFKAVARTNAPFLVIRAVEESVTKDTQDDVTQRAFTVAVEVVALSTTDRDAISDQVETEILSLNLANVPISLEGIEFEVSEEGSQHRLHAAIHSYVFQYLKDPTS